MGYIKLENVNKVYGKTGNQTVALKNVSLEINKGELVAITGDSGSGKSTLLNIMGCMDLLTEGRYMFEDTPVHELKGNKLDLFRREKISFVFQQFALMNRYTVYENARLPLNYRRLSRQKKKEIVELALEQVGILHLKDKNVSDISGGEQQRCAIARAIVSGSEVVLADEPTGALDSGNAAKIMELLLEVNKSGKTVVVVTHDFKIAEKCRRIIRISDGEIVKDERTDC